MMISSVDGNNAISYTLLQSKNGTSPTEQLSKTNSDSSSTDGEVTTTQNQSENLAQSGDLSSSDSTNDLGSTAQNTTNVVSFQQKSNTLTINYGKKKDSNDGETYYSNDTSYIPTSFSELAAMVGSCGGKVTKDQLNSYLQSLTSASSSKSVSAGEITVVKNLIAQFDTLSNGTGYITSLKGVNEAQDYTTITSDQVTSPIDIRV